MPMLVTLGPEFLGLSAELALEGWSPRRELPTKGLFTAAVFKQVRTFHIEVPR